MDVRALVVDDSGIMRKMVMRSLKETELAEFTFVEAEDGVDALQKFDPDEIDMVFADWNMPNMTGIELVRMIRETCEDIPIVMITTESTMAKVEEALDSAGADGYVVKPFTPDVLTKKLTPLFERMAAGGDSKGFFGKLASKFS